MNNQRDNQPIYSSLQRNGLEVIQPSKVAPNYDSMLHNRPNFKMNPPQINNGRYDNLKDYGNLSQRVTPDQTMRQIAPQTIYTSANQQYLQQPHYEPIEMQKQQVEMRKYHQNRDLMKNKDRMEDQINSMVMRSQMAQKTPEQIINEFKAYTLPKLRLKRLIKMQALMKGYYIRRFFIPKLRLRLRAYNMMAEEFLRKTLYDKFVPDLVMEVIAYNKHNQDLTLYSDKHQAYLKMINELMDRVVLKMARDVVKEQTDYLVTSILQQRFRDKPEAEKDPMKLLVFQLIQGFLSNEVQIIAKEAIQDQSQQYYKDLQYMKIIKEITIPNTVRVVVLEALDELVLEKYLDDLFKEMTRQISEPLATKMIQLLEAERESESLDKALDNYILRMMGDVLIEHLLLIDYQQEVQE